MTTTLTLRDARRKRRMTQDDLADKSGVDQTHISSIETGRRVPSDEVRQRLAKALGIAPSKLRFSEPEPNGSLDRGRDRTGQSSTSTHSGSRF